jgi:hypothetical protein
MYHYYHVYNGTDLIAVIQADDMMTVVHQLRLAGIKFQRIMRWV